MIGRPRRSTPLPYPTRFRPDVGLDGLHVEIAEPLEPARVPVGRADLVSLLGQEPRHVSADEARRSGYAGDHAPRSEEHTSELQSRQYLVCRLLLEKKNPTHTHRPATFQRILQAVLCACAA